METQNETEERSRGSSNVIEGLSKDNYDLFIRMKERSKCLLDSLTPSLSSDTNKMNHSTIQRFIFLSNRNQILSRNRSDIKNILRSTNVSTPFNSFFGDKSPMRKKANEKLKKPSKHTKNNFEYQTHQSPHKKFQPSKMVNNDLPFGMKPFFRTFSGSSSSINSIFDMNYSDSEEEKFGCTICAAIFSTMSSLRKHKTRKHSKKTKVSRSLRSLKQFHGFPENERKKTYLAASILKKIIKKTERKNLNTLSMAKCSKDEKCENKKIKCGTNFKKHNDSKNIGLVCKKCHSIFINNHYLKQHLQMDHKRGRPHKYGIPRTSFPPEYNAEVRLKMTEQLNSVVALWLGEK